MIETWKQKGEQVGTALLYATIIKVVKEIQINVFNLIKIMNNIVIQQNPLIWDTT
jgi:hypothetical protein